MFVHAGIGPGRTMEQQTRHDLLSIRDDFLRARLALPGRVVVHGHTICDEPKDLGRGMDVKYRSLYQWPSDLPGAARDGTSIFDDGPKSTRRVSCGLIQRGRRDVVSTKPPSTPYASRGAKRRSYCRMDRVDRPDRVLPSCSHAIPVGPQCFSRRWQRPHRGRL